MQLEEHVQRSSIIQYGYLLGSHSLSIRKVVNAPLARDALPDTMGQL